jgi:peptidoglycan/LPS O-acetylase OafA/YrhL
MFFIIRRRGEVGALVLLAVGLAAIEPFYHFVGGYGHCLTLLWVIGSGTALAFHNLPTLRTRWPRLSDRHIRRVAAALTVAGMLFMVGRYFATKGQIYELQFGLFLALFLFALLFALGGISAHFGVSATFGILAGYSYSLYLIHHTLLDLVWTTHPSLEGSPIAFWSMILLCNFAAIAFWWLFERHHRQLARLARGWLARRRAAALAS